ncbi:Rho GTPase [Medicago truncatula]|uniref:Rho GTPase n=1 Tax=Medicago truncatula TaxID=3880 RepID=G7K1G8_MEDTR|nr:Rho GTPase [Medicago truncatula]
MEKGPPEATWTSVELTDEAIDFLETIFDEFDGDFDKVLQPRELEELFSTAPESPWIENPYKDAVGRNIFGELSLDAFLSEWALMTLLNPTLSVESLINIGYPGFVFGPRKAGKSALLNSFIGRPYSEAYNETNEDRFAVNIVDISRENKKYLVLREISEGGVTKLLANKKSLASCDIAIFVYDRSDESSWKASYELLLKIVRHGEDTGFQVPCLMVAAKDDKDSFTMVIEEETTVSQDMEVDAPIPISVKLGNFNNVFHRIVSAAEPPHLSIPETEAGKTHKPFHTVIDRSLKFVSAVVAVAFVVVVARKNVAARKNASG